MAKKDEKLDGMVNETNEGGSNSSSRSRVKAALEASRSANTAGTGVKETKEIKEEKVMEEQAKKLTLSDEIIDNLEELENGDSEVDGESRFNNIMNGLYARAIPKLMDQFGVSDKFIYYLRAIANHYFLYLKKVDAGTLTEDDSPLVLY